jgi:hypothetical protein
MMAMKKLKSWVASDIGYTTVLRFIWKNKRIAQKTRSFFASFFRKTIGSLSF